MSDDRPALDALVDAARAEGSPDADDRARVRRRLTAQLGVAAFAVAAPAGAASAGKVAGLFGAGVVRYVAAVTLVAAAGGGVAALHTRQGNTPPPSSTVRAARPRVSVQRDLPAPPPPPTVAPAPPPATAPAPSLPPPAASPRSHARRSVAPEAPALPPAASVAAEVNALRDARRAMNDGDPARALAILDGYERSAAGGGALRVERFAARLIAQCRLGQGRALEVQSFFLHHGASPLAPSVDAACRRR